MALEFLPFIVQGVVLGVDEFYCHQRRPLKRWERIGHPVDTVAFVMSLAWIYFVPPSPLNWGVYVTLGILSCLLITKDEWQHKELCSGFENWLHAILFILHPVLLIWAGWLWWSGAENFVVLIGTVLGLSTGWALFQALYWNWWRRD